eukprot:1156860-Pelagomonas_calceolata.AAC.13
MGFKPPRAVPLNSGGREAPSAIIPCTAAPCAICPPPKLRSLVVRVLTPPPIPGRHFRKGSRSLAFANSRYARLCAGRRHMFVGWGACQLPVQLRKFGPCLAPPEGVRGD